MTADKKSPEKPAPAPAALQQQSIPPQPANYPPPIYGYAMDPNWIAAHGGMMPQYHGQYGVHGYVTKGRLSCGCAVVRGIFGVEGMTDWACVFHCEMIFVHV
jgi:hypothetical protein